MHTDESFHNTNTPPADTDQIDESHEKDPTSQNDCGNKEFSTKNLCEKFSPQSKDLSEKNGDNHHMVMNIPVNVQIILGSCRMQISHLVNLSKGDVITLDRRIGESVDITVNNQKIAKGEITIMEEDDTHFGVRLTEILNSS
ncbi:flagellar motor switch protein FliN [Candidatus Liberibacter sp.]|uniref:flagellar motor switch protein FliN n=1 Tax=Candidatus Liberibacter sp. TaxID=34022 RepID=UPI0015F48040|nr:flagellar motor switch protein FliN [Candidatus Liberibacter sp.]MBA5723616.1 flagellar motor switch protein FliN [Candidatus Liberibacter sp.]